MNYLGGKADGIIDEQYFEGMVKCIIVVSLRVTIKFLIPASFKGLNVKFTLNFPIYNFW